MKVCHCVAHCLPHHSKVDVLAACYDLAAFWVARPMTYLLFEND